MPSTCPSAENFSAEQVLVCANSAKPETRSPAHSSCRAHQTRGVSPAFAAFFSRFLCSKLGISAFPSTSPWSDARSRPAAVTAATNRGPACAWSTRVDSSSPSGAAVSSSNNCNPNRAQSEPVQTAGQAVALGNCETLQNSAGEVPAPAWQSSCLPGCSPRGHHPQAQSP
jgi:hypothetical protein